MITTGIIRSVTQNKQINNKSSVIKKLSNGTSSEIFYNAYEVEILIFKSSSSINSDDCVRTSYCANQSGIYTSYEVGDKVFIEFYNNEFSYPIIIGKINESTINTSDENSLITNSRSLALLKDLIVSNEVILPKDTVIGEISYSSLLTAIQVVNGLDLKSLTTSPLLNVSAGDGLILDSVSNKLSVNTGYTTVDKNYAVQSDDSGKLFVNVPWKESEIDISKYYTKIETDDLIKDKATQESVGVISEALTSLTSRVEKLEEEIKKLSSESTSSQ